MTIPALPQEVRTSRRAFLSLLAGVGAGGALLLQRDGVASAATPTDQLAQAELEQAAQKAELCSSANAAGVGLRGEYFADERCRGTPMLVRLDGSIDFDASLDWPVERRRRPRSVRWSGWVKPPLAGLYRFHAGVADARVLVSQQVLAGPDAEPQADIELAAGRFYPISVELNRIAPDANGIRLEWTAPHGARFLVPRALLYLPTDGIETARS